MRSRIINSALAFCAVVMLAVVAMTAIVDPRRAVALSSEHRVLAVLTRVVPDGASISYAVDGRIVQSMPLRAGTYRLTVEEIR